MAAGPAVLGGSSTRVGTRGGEDGSIVVLFALLLTLFLLLGAITIDVGYWWVMGKKAQIAADACALGAAQELPHNYADIDNCLVEAGQGDYVLVNIPVQVGPESPAVHLFTRLTSPYHENPSLVEATVRMRVPTFFGRIVGLQYVEVERRAVAERLEGAAKMAIFTASTDCSSGLRIDGDAIHITGHVHSNGEYTVNGAAPPNQVTFTSGAIARENCVADTNPDGPPPSSAGAVYGDGEDWLPQDGEELQWPEWFYPADFGWYLSPAPGDPSRCTYKGEDILIDATTLKITGQADQSLPPNPDKPGWTKIPTGTYCATKSFKIGGDEHTGEITALSPIIVIDGNGQQYTPHVANMLFFTVPNVTSNMTDDGPFAVGVFSPSDKPPYPPCMPSPAIETNLNGENYTWGGIIFNPCGKVKINNKTSSVGTPQLVGTIYGFQVEINGDGFNMIGTEDSGTTINTALVE